MTSQQILQADLLDILFEGRNKQYGAYQLRRTYPFQLLKALGLSLAIVFLLLYFFKPNFSKTLLRNSGVEVVLHTVDLPKPKQKMPELPKPPDAAKTPIKQQNFTDHIQMTQKEIIDPLPPIDAMKDVAISNVTTEGTGVGNLQPQLTPEVKGTGSGMPVAETDAKKEVVPDRQPQFPGGMQAWIAFLGKNLRSPEELESGEKRTVVIRFHVAEDGSVTGFKVEKSAGNAFDEEVMRVLRKMPKWTPALQGGHPVSVSFTQPVTYVAME
jgi:protein TonB